ncbi:Rieske (2Fe-2S) protein [Salinispora arenicola]|uniref:Rieske (2Fe-2S) domain protein n=1 Tax=Salinispora arenicola (strain CNS-205) TaxID=391037 RepID=A8LW32_SALAI|nr:Rieske (2Fe-2S) protein [Salinispora arenicola]MCN0153842.1 Rieske (2Fe-2S) protein [Salinispora arenicola]MCN0178280.1 Rieske (2Fe-2S) protein [Salinispora arenicola]NIL41111.1 Rieske (2Fe-2S) protein [Salinispora arenicola]NIL56854.1 Rieske (2Fe-2S) protein [Salinispora arenicola]NIL60408.1 Rieske (2Fe-2S) protein [Salinispora arenicola]
MSDEQVRNGTDPDVRTRRALLTGAGAVGAAVALAACSDSADGETTVSPGPSLSDSGDPGGGDREGAQSLARTSDIPVGGGAVYPAQGVVITQPSPGEFKGFDPICPHQNCPVANVDGGTINCTCHGSKFSIENGSVLTGPSTQPLAPRDVKVTGDRISLA